MDDNTLFEIYSQLGWALCPIPAGLKHPTGEAWNSPFMAGLPPDWAEVRGGCGLMHAYSGTGAIDVDQLVAALVWLQLKRGIDLQGLLDAPDAVQIVSGAEGKAKLLYRLPGDLVLPTVTFSHEGRHMIQFRCATKGGKSVQDVLPPSVYPGTARRYRWGGKGDFRRLPTIPWDILELWMTEAGLAGAGTKDDRGNGRSTTQPIDLDPQGQEMRKIRAALKVLNPDMVRDDWLKVGMALHAADPGLLGLWEEWSRGGDKYDNDPSQPRPEAIWDGFGRGGGPQVGLGTLYRLADQTVRENPELGDWRRASIDLEALFQSHAAPGGSPPGQQPAGAAPASAQQPGAADPLEQGLPSYDELLAEAMRLRPLDDVRVILARAVGLTPTEQDRLVGTIAEKAQVGRAAVREELRQLEKAVRAGSEGSEGRIPEILRPLFASFCHVGQLDVLFQPSTRSYYKPQAFDHAYRHLNERALELALDGGVVKVDRIDYVPGQAPLFEDNGVRYINMWTGIMNRGREGDCSLWLEHFKVLGLENADIEHLLQWMAFTLRHPERKINHGVILSGLEGVGKDGVFTPLDRALAENATIMDAVSLFSDFNAELLGRKFVRINETALGGERGSRNIEEKLKPMLATPPERIWVNEKGIAKFEVRNIFNVAITTNSNHPLHISPGSRRYFALRSDLDMQGPDGNITPQWRAYWQRFWAWMRDEAGWEHCVWHLMNRVSLANFDPGLAPPSTAFRRQIQADSRSDLEAAIAELIETREDVFSLPLVRAEDVHQMFTLGRNSNPYVLRYGLKVPPSTGQLGKVVRDARLTRLDTCMGWNRKTRSRARHTLWVLEEPPGYQEMSGHERVELYNSLVEAYWKARAEENVTPFR